MLPEDEVQSVWYHCHASTYDGHFGPNKAILKALKVGFYWPTLFKDAKKVCDDMRLMPMNEE